MPPPRPRPPTRRPNPRTGGHRSRVHRHRPDQRQPGRPGSATVAGPLPRRAPTHHLGRQHHPARLRRHPLPQNPPRAPHPRPTHSPATPARLPPRPPRTLQRPAHRPPAPDSVIEVHRTVNPAGCVALGGTQFSVGMPLAGYWVLLRIDAHLVHVVTDGLLRRTLPSPLTPTARSRLHGARLAGPSPRVNHQPTLNCQASTEERHCRAPPPLPNFRVACRPLPAWIYGRPMEASPRGPLDPRQRRTIALCSIRALTLPSATAIKQLRDLRAHHSEIIIHQRAAAQPGSMIRHLHQEFLHH